MDYWYITSGGLFSRKEMPHPQTTEGEETPQNDRRQRKVMKCLIVRCYESKALCAHCVPCKGADEEKYVVSLVTSDIASMGPLQVYPEERQRRRLEIRCHVPDVTHATSEEAGA